MLGHHTQYNEERHNLRDFLISDSKNQAWREFSHTLPGRLKFLTEDYVANEPEDKLMDLFGSNMPYSTKCSQCCDVPKGCTETRQEKLLAVIWSQEVAAILQFF
jgi:hypothetical protein